jgi:hypothetical protein
VLGLLTILKYLITLAVRLQLHDLKAAKNCVMVLLKLFEEGKLYELLLQLLQVLLSPQVLMLL